MGLKKERVACKKIECLSLFSKSLTFIFEMQFFVSTLPSNLNTLKFFTRWNFSAFHRLQFMGRINAQKEISDRPN